MRRAVGIAEDAGETPALQREPSFLEIAQGWWREHDSVITPGNSRGRLFST
jgi:hypothetical protein